MFTSRRLYGNLLTADRDDGPQKKLWVAAIDINASQTDYWVWAGKKAGGPVPYKNRIPFEIVEIFEAEKFIWGGKWYHYDTMHFEYRPECFA